MKLDIDVEPMGQLVYSKGMKVANNPETEGTQ